LFHKAIDNPTDKIVRDGIKNDQFTMSFSVNSAGYPVNVIITNGSCDSCKSEALKLVQSYQWKLQNRTNAIISVTY